MTDARVSDESPEMNERARRASRRWFHRLLPADQDRIIRRAFEAEVPRGEWKSWVDGTPEEKQ